MLLCDVRQHIKNRCVIHITHIILILWALQQHNQKNNVHICGNLHSESECEPLDMRVTMAFTMVMSKRGEI
jgi:hypothetical protein